MAHQLSKDEYDRDGDLRPSEHVAVHTIVSVKGSVLARAGASCGRVPRCDLEWLLEDGHIRPKDVTSIVATRDRVQIRPRV